jgi:hypothetical protein
MAKYQRGILLDEEICNIIDDTVHFEQQGYNRTATQIISLAKSIDKKQILSIEELSGRISLIYDIFNDEFAKIYPIGKDYRKRCFTQTQQITLKAFLLMKSQHVDIPAEYSQFMNKMGSTDDSINPMSKTLRKLLIKPNRSKEESINMFSQACFTYQIALEGIFSQLVKLLYGLMSIVNGKIPKYSENDTSFIWQVYHNFEKEFSLKPVFLERWPEKSSLRNAIAHAQAQYDPVLDIAHFFSKDSTTGQTYDRNMSFKEFFAIWMEVADAVDSFRYSIRLYGIMESLLYAYLKITTKSKSEVNEV